MTTEADHTELCEFIQQHADTRLKEDLLLFWRKYPHARFTSGIVARAVDRNRRVDVEEALECLVEADLLEKHIQSGFPLYRLTTLDPSKRECIMSLPRHRAALRTRCAAAL